MRQDFAEENLQTLQFYLFVCVISLWISKCYNFFPLKLLIFRWNFGDTWVMNIKLCEKCLSLFFLYIYSFNIVTQRKVIKGVSI